MKRAVFALTDSPSLGRATSVDVALHPGRSAAGLCFLAGGAASARAPTGRLPAAVDAAAVAAVVVGRSSESESDCRLLTGAAGLARPIDPRAAGLLGLLGLLGFDDEDAPGSLMMARALCMSEWVRARLQICRSAATDPASGVAKRKANTCIGC